jgi:hypothetical protein
MKIDRTGEQCLCGGTFEETSLHDDIDGTLHCNKCGEKINRYGNSYSPLDDSIEEHESFS